MSPVPEAFIGKKGRCAKCQMLFILENEPPPPDPVPETRMPDAAGPEPTRPAAPDSPPHEPPETRPLAADDAPSPAPTRPSRRSTPDQASPHARRKGSPGLLLDLYQVLGKLGEGGFGTVHKVRHTGWNIELAMKSPRPEALQQAGGADNFVREAQTWVELGFHPHIVSCHYVRVIKDIPRVFAEYVRGGSLEDWIRQGRLQGVEHILDVAIGFAWGLEYAHGHGLVHQDIKPANVMMSEDGVPKITDFGLARARVAESLPGQGPEGSALVTTGGYTPAFASPEQMAGGRIGSKADMWAFGLSVLEMFTGGVTWTVGVVALAALEDFLSRSGQDGSPAMPAALAALLRQCFQEDSAHRPESMTVVADTLQALYEEVSGNPHPRRRPRAGADTADSLNNHALSLLDMGLDREAAAAWEKANRLDPQHRESYYNFILHSYGRTSLMEVDVLNIYKEIAQSHEGDPACTAYQGRLNLLCNDYGNAVGLLERALPGLDDRDALRDLGLAQLALARTMEFCQDKDDARARYKELIRKAVANFVSSLGSGITDPVAATGLARALEADGRSRDIARAEYNRHMASQEGSLSYETAIHRLLPGHACLADCSIPFEGPAQCAVSRDGRFLASVSQGRLHTCRLDEQSGTIQTPAIHALPDNEQGLCIAMLDASRQVFIGTDQGRLYWWDVNKGGLVRSAQPIQGPVHGLAVSPDGSVLACLSRHHGELALCDARTGAVRAGYTHRGHAFTRACVFRDNVHVLAVAVPLKRKGPEELLLWNTSSGTASTLRNPEGFPEFPWESISFAETGELALTTMYINRIAPISAVWDLRQGKHFFTIQGAAAFLPGGSRILMQDLENQSSTGQMIIEVLDLASRQRSMHTGFKGGVTGLAVAGDGGHYAYWFKGEPGNDQLYEGFCSVDMKSGAHALCLWDKRKDMPPALVRNPRHALPLADGLMALLGDNQVSIVDVLNRYQPAWAIVRPRSAEEQTSLADEFGDLLTRADEHFTSGDIRAALLAARQARDVEGFARDPRILDLWDRLGLHCVRTGIRGLWGQSSWKVHEPAIFSNSSNVRMLSGDCSTVDGSLAVCSGTESIGLWNTSAAELIRTFESPGDAFLRVAFSPCGRQLAGATTGGVIRIFDVESGNLACERALDGAVVALAPRPTPYSSEFFVAMEDGRVHVLDRQTGELLRSFEGTMERIINMTVSADGRHLYLQGSPQFTAIDSSSGRVTQVIARPPVTHVIPSIGPDCFVGVTQGLKLFRWSPQQGKASFLFSLPERDMESARDTVSLDNRFVMLCGKERLCVYDVEQGTLLKEIELFQDCEMYFAHFIPWTSAALCLSTEGTARLVSIDWELEYRDPVEWNDAALPYMQHMLTRCGHVPKPEWANLGSPDTVYVPDEELEGLYDNLAWAGLGWIGRDGVKNKLTELAECVFIGPDPNAPKRSARLRKGQDQQTEALMEEFQDGLGKVMMDAIISPDKENKAGIDIPGELPAIPHAPGAYCPDCREYRPKGDRCSVCGLLYAHYQPLEAWKQLTSRVAAEMPVGMSGSPFGNQRAKAQMFQLRRAILESLNTCAQDLANADEESILGAAMALLYTPMSLPILYPQLVPPKVTKMIRRDAGEIIRFLLPNPYELAMVMPMAQTMQNYIAALKELWSSPQKDLPVSFTNSPKQMAVFLRAPEILGRINASLADALGNPAAINHLGNVLHALIVKLTSPGYLTLYLEAFPGTRDKILLSLQALTAMASVFTRFTPDDQAGRNALEPFLGELRNNIREELKEKKEKDKAEAVGRVDIQREEISYDSVEAIMNHFRPQFPGKNPYIAPNIPDKKLRNACIAFGETSRMDRSLALLDTTIFGSAKEGALLTDTTIYVRDMMGKPQSFDYRDIHSASLQTKLVANCLEINGKEVLTNIPKDAGGLVPFAKLIRALMSFHATAGPAEEELRLEPQGDPVAGQAAEEQTPPPPSIQEYLDAHPDLAKALDSFRDLFDPQMVHMAPSIPPKLRASATKNVMDLERGEHVLLIVDTKKDGSLSRGLALTNLKIASVESLLKKSISLDRLGAFHYRPSMLGGMFSVGEDSLPFLPATRELGMQLADLLNEIVPLIEAPDMEQLPHARPSQNIHDVLATRCKGRLPDHMSRGHDLPVKVQKKVHKLIIENLSEVPLLYMDTTILGKGKTGLVLTEDNLHVRDTMSKPVHYPLSTIRTIKLRKDTLNSSLVINGQTDMVGVSFDLVEGVSLIADIIRDVLGL